MCGLAKPAGAKRGLEGLSELLLLVPAAMRPSTAPNAQLMSSPRREPRWRLSEEPTISCLQPEVSRPSLAMRQTPWEAPSAVKNTYTSRPQMHAPQARPMNIGCPPHPMSPAPTQPTTPRKVDDAEAEASAAMFLSWLEAEEVAVAEARQRRANRKAAMARVDSPRTPRGPNGIGNAHRVPLH